MPVMLPRFSARACALAAALTWAISAQAETVLRFIPYADLSILDPVWTPGIVSRNFGYMVYDTLFAVDHNFKPQPQMVGSWTVSDDKLTWDFTLRDGLKWHDGAPVRGADCAASVKRWGVRSGSWGQPLMAAAASIEATGEKTFRIVLKKPFPVLDALATLTTPTPFMMPERLANTDPYTAITEVDGSGPFKFVKEAFEPGLKAVFVKNTDYLPRGEPGDWGTGGKVVKVDRVEWTYIPDATTAAQALISGEMDRWEYATTDLLPLLRAQPNIKIEKIFPIGNGAALRFNELQAPFNNEKMRQALLAVADQREYMSALAGPQENWNTCYSFYACGTPAATEDGAEPLKGPRDYDKAKSLIAEAGYKGEKINLLTAADYPVSQQQSLVTFEMLKKLGLNVEMVTVDWSTLLKRRMDKDPVDKGGWSLFHTTIPPYDLLDPATNAWMRGNGEKAFPGWPSDPKLEQLHDAYLDATDDAKRREIAVAAQREAFESVPYVPTGQFFFYTAYRDVLSGRIPMHVPALWGIEKKSE
jgi:peptide/nickel transport system substrate-binding protein